MQMNKSCTNLLSGPLLALRLLSGCGMEKISEGHMEITGEEQNVENTGGQCVPLPVTQIQVLI